MRDTRSKRTADAFCSAAEVMSQYLPGAEVSDVQIPDDVSATVDRMVAKLVESIAQRPAAQARRRGQSRNHGANA